MSTYIFSINGSSELEISADGSLVARITDGNPEVGVIGGQIAVLHSGGSVVLSARNDFQLLGEDTPALLTKAIIATKTLPQIAAIISSNIFNYKGGSATSTYDPVAQAFFNVNTGLSAGNKTAVDNLVKALRAIGLSKFKAVYPFVGGSAAAHKWNLMDPRDLDAAFRLNFIGGWTHDANGVTGDGTTGYANTFIVPHTDIVSNLGFSSLDDWKTFHLGFYNRTAVIPNKHNMLFGAARGAFQLSYNVYNVNNYSVFSGPSTDALSLAGQGVFKGFHLLNRVTTTLAKTYRDMSQIIADNANSYAAIADATATPLFFGSLNNAGAPNTFSSLNCGFFSVGDGLTEAQANYLHKAVLAFQTALGRNV